MPVGPIRVKDKVYARFVKKDYNSHGCGRRETTRTHTAKVSQSARVDTGTRVFHTSPCACCRGCEGRRCAKSIGTMHINHFFTFPPASAGRIFLFALPKPSLALTRTQS